MYIEVLKLSKKVYLINDREMSKRQNSFLKKSITRAGYV